MKKLSILLFAAIFAFAACEKDQDQTNDISLKKKPTGNTNTGNGNGGGGATQNNFVIVSQAGDPLVLEVGEIAQLTLAPDPTLYVDWYVIDSQIAIIYWDGRVEGIAPGVTVISAFHYQQQGQPLQDNLVVTVVPAIP